MQRYRAIKLHRHIIVKELSTTRLPDYNTPVEIDKIKLSSNKWRRKDLDGQSLIADTLQAMKDDGNSSGSLDEQTAVGPKMTLDEKKIRRRALNNLGIPDFTEFISLKLNSDEGSLRNAPIDNARKFAMHKRNTAEVLQLNIGLYCNQACSHCHVESSPRRKEMMSIETADRCLSLLEASPSVKVLDITGGAPELNMSFRHLIREARKLRPSKKDLDIIDRCNLTVVHEPGQEDLIDFLADHSVHIVASLPCYSAKNVNMQRGKGVFDRSISALLAFNEVGYGINESLHLDLVYNPLGPFLPPPQDKLSEKYKEELLSQFGIHFNNLYTMTNMPIKRFADFLYRRGELESYMDLLARNFNISTLSGLMCRNTVSVGWDGRVYDCDFNQQLGLSIGTGKSFTDEGESNRNIEKICGTGKNTKIMMDSTVYSIQTLDDLRSHDINYDNHCFGMYICILSGLVVAICTTFKFVVRMRIFNIINCLTT